jgi:hypothetical protein
VFYLAAVNRERETFERLSSWIEVALRPAAVIEAILGFVGGLWIVLTFESQCWPLIGNILAPPLDARRGSEAGRLVGRAGGAAARR